MENEKIIAGNSYLFRLNFSEFIGIPKGTLERMDGTVACVKEVRDEIDSAICYFGVINGTVCVPLCSLVEIVSEQIKISKVRGDYNAQS